jgi:two-component system chemotaxis sensor kinase CheA
VERERLRFVVTVVRNRDEFFDLVAEFRQFQRQEVEQILAASRPEKENHAELYRRIHTYKGLFAQLDFIELPKRIHDLETIIARFGEQASTNPEAVWLAFEQSGCDQALESDLEILRRFLGKAFFSDQRRFHLDEQEVAALEQLAARLTGQTLAEDPQVEPGLAIIQRLRQVDFRTLIEGYSRYVQQLAQRLEKSLQSLRIEGEPAAVSHDRFAPFAKSLIHLFRNAVEHGIETPDLRLAADKPEQGAIRCRIERREGELLLHFSDDGQGLDPEVIKAIALEKGMITAQQAEQMNEKAVLELIFADGFSSRNRVSELSGRGEGLAAVRAECERLGGRVWIESAIGAGTHFHFALPLSDNSENRSGG